MSTTQFNSSITWLTDINLCESDWTSNVCDNCRDKDKDTVPALVTRETASLAFTTLVRRGEDLVIKSVSSKVIWSEAPESRGQASRSPLPEEVAKPKPMLPIPELGPAFWDWTWGIRERWGSADTTATLPVLASVPVPSFFFLACNSYHQSG
jgi:hypothetical protein